jgi:hypothetical protein
VRIEGGDAAGAGIILSPCLPALDPTGRPH